MLYEPVEDAVQNSWLRVGLDRCNCISEAPKNLDVLGTLVLVEELIEEAVDPLGFVNP